MDINQKVANAIRLIERGIQLYSKPVIAWSGGKDSMALLDLVHNKVGCKLPVVFYREQWQPWKYQFQNRIIEEWGLEVYTWHPTATAFQQNGDEFEVQNVYAIDKSLMSCPTGITPIEEDKPWVCSLDIYNRPRSPGIVAGWDLMFIGHKGCDSDPIYGGNVGTRIDARVMQNGEFSSFFPMKDWSHDDVFQYCENYGVPIQHSRYEKVDGKWRERSDRTNNCDYVHACTACVDRRDDAPKFVYCPKVKGIIENVSKQVVWTDHQPGSYMRD
jgi:3'-phosphoadenosine 5'-phosphosulfate sulfotransferase (PAPS reductase)/FAD synthetase